MKCNFDFSKEKNLILKTTRGIGFEDIIDALEKDKELDNFRQTSKKHPNQRVVVVEVNNYAYAAPYVVDKVRNVVFLKTVYPSRKHTKKYLRNK